MSHAFTSRLKFIPNQLTLLIFIFSSPGYLTELRELLSY